MGPSLAASETLIGTAGAEHHESRLILPDPLSAAAGQSAGDAKPEDRPLEEAPGGLSPEWVQDLCQRLSLSSGCELRFVPLHESLIDSAMRTVDQSSELTAPHWTAPIHDGEQATGWIRVRSPLTDSAEKVTAAQDLGELLSDLLRRLSVAHRKLATRTREVTTLMELGRTVAHGETWQAAVARLLRAAVDLTGMWASALFVIDPRSFTLRLRAHHAPQRMAHPQPDRALLGRGPDDTALREGYRVVTRDMPESSQVLPPDVTVGICVAVTMSSGSLGTLWCYDRRQVEVNPQRIQALLSVGHQLGAVFERQTLLQESAHQRRMQTELAAVSSRQMLLPQRVPADWGIEIACRAAGAAELTGDLCEVIPHERQVRTKGTRSLFRSRRSAPRIDTSRKLFLAIGDAVGHSLPAAMIMAKARGGLRALLDQWQQADLANRTAGPTRAFDTTAVMTVINRVLYQLTHSEQFMTMICGVVDCEQSTLTYTNAGHPCPLLLRGGNVIPLKSHGLLLGIAPDASYEHSVLRLESGDLLVFFTDGVTEAFNSQRQLFRNEGILAAARGTVTANSSAEEVADAIWNQLERHLHGSATRDDRTLLVLKRR